jgi:hypothetical protein
MLDHADNQAAQVRAEAATEAAATREEAEGTLAAAGD